MTPTPNYYQLPDLPKVEAKPIDGLGPVPVNNKEWKEWYEEVLLHRKNMAELTETPWKGQEQARANEIVRVAKDGRYWLSVYGAIYNAKPDEDTEEFDDWDTENTAPTGFLEPLIPYLFQLYYWDAQMKAFRTRGPHGDVIVLKTRQMGMSNIGCAVYSWAWMAKRPFQGRLLSRKEDLVDETNNPDSLFWKVDMQLRATPDWMLQAFAPGFDWRYHRMLASLTNPANLNHLAGESTNATAGRGSAATGVLLDEWGFMRDGGGIFTTVRSATRHRTAISTATLKFGPHLLEWVERCKANPAESPVLLMFPYYLHPYQDDEWLRQERSRDTEQGIQTEVLMNFYGDVSDFVYPGAGNKEVGDFPYIPYAGDVFLTIDDGITGYWAMLLIQYIHADGRHRVIDAYRNNGKITDFYGGLIRGQMLDGFSYGEDELAFMNSIRGIPNIIFVGDTHGKNIEQVSGMSVIERLAEKWGIYVNVDFTNRSDRDRQEYTAKYLPFTDFNNTPRVQTSLRSIKRYRWKEIDASDELLSIPKSPIKNHDSHDPTALEYYFTNFEQMRNIYVPGGYIQYGG